jgi:cell division initiation protein
MKITPLDIQQQQFRVRFRGFDMVEVDNFLELLANEFEELIKENNQLREEDRRKLARINELEAEEKELRDLLLSAKKITEEMKNNARREGELIIEEAKAQARKIIDNAQAQALKIETEINNLKKLRAQLEASLKATIDMHLRLLESYQEEKVNLQEKLLEEKEENDASR